MTKSISILLTTKDPYHPAGCLQRGTVESLSFGDGGGSEVLGGWNVFTYGTVLVVI